jgi:microcystin-dependent protein
MLFAQTSAPTGWTKSITHDDKALRVVSGTASSGGSTAFSSVFASRTPGGTVGATTLAESQIPSHSHGFTASVSSVNRSSNVPLTSTGAAPAGGTTGGTGGGGSHNHSFTGTAMDFAVQYVDVIIATKN